MRYKGFKYKDGAPVDLRFAQRKLAKNVDDRARAVYEQNQDKLLQLFLIAAFHVLHDKFGFGDVRLNRFREDFLNTLECVGGDFVDWGDLVNNIRIVEK